MKQYGIISKVGFNKLLTVWEVQFENTDITLYLKTKPYERVGEVIKIL